MVVEYGYWNVNTVPTYSDNKKYYICSHKCNPTKLELVFEYKDRFSGNNKELIKFVENGFR